MSEHLESITMQAYLADENTCEALGAKLGAAILGHEHDTRNKARGSESIVIYFHGELGAGKTTMIRGLLRRFGHKSAVKSPTYTLIEPYVLGADGDHGISSRRNDDHGISSRRNTELHIYHLDLYRLADPEELELLGLRDFLTGNAIILVEWPERGRGFLPQATLVVRLEYAKHGRNCTIESISDTGRCLIGRISRCGK